MGNAGVGIESVAGTDAEKRRKGETEKKKAQFGRIMSFGAVLIRATSLYLPEVGSG
jgi:hypothetical protein